MDYSFFIEYLKQKQYMANKMGGSYENKRVVWNYKIST